VYGRGKNAAQFIPGWPYSSPSQKRNSGTVKEQAKQRLCWQNADGEITAAPILWRRSSIETRHGYYETAGQGSAVILTKTGLRALTATAPILLTHQITRSFSGGEDSDQPENGSQSAIAAIAPLTM